MSKTFTNSTQACATCANWGGPRTEKFGNSVETSDPSVRGKCYKGHGDALPGPCACAGYGCRDYTKWGALK